VPDPEFGKGCLKELDHAVYIPDAKIGVLHAHHFAVLLSLELLQKKLSKVVYARRIDFVNTFIYKLRVVKKRRKQAELRTRRAIVDRLKLNGPQDARQLAASLDVSPMAVRQHLYDLEKNGLVLSRDEPRPLGRPAKLWRLTPAADRFFPDGHAELTVGLIAALREAFGSEGLDRLVLIRSAHQRESYRDRIPQHASLRRRLQALAQVRTEEGYLAEVQDQEDGSFLLIENHCPICVAATACTGLCSSELEVFRGALGPSVEIARTEHIVSGARRCAYRVRKGDAA
jgi:predicted ArsR family transcriptional regulator